MSSNLSRALGSILFGAVSAGTASAQGWFICDAPNNPRSNDFSVATISNDLWLTSVGFAGTITYGDQNGPCFSPALGPTAIRGRFGFAVGPEGSAQSGFDNNLALTFGMPLDPAGSWSTAVTVVDGAQTGFGDNAMVLQFNGASDRYIYQESVNDGVRVRVRFDVVGDATRVQWDLTNENDEAANVGLWYGAWTAMVNSVGQTKSFSGDPNNSVYVTVPGQKPPLTDVRYVRQSDPANFPPYVRFNFGQTNAYGLQVDNGPTAATTNPNTGVSDATLADEFSIGDAGLLLNAPGGSIPFPDAIIPDTFIGRTSFLQKFNPVALSSGASRRIVQWFRSTWGTSNYSPPYAVVADAPKLLPVDEDDNGTNGYDQNPFPLRVLVDNVVGFSNIEDGVPLSDVKVTVTLPEGLNFVGFPSSTRSRQLTIGQILPRQNSSVTMQVEADGTVFGDLPYTVRVQPAFGPIKTMTGNINVATIPRLRLFPDANLVSTPYLFTDNNWEAVLGLNNPGDFQAFEWDPQQKGYVISTSASRGKGVWIVYNGGENLVDLQSNPTVPPDVVPLPATQGNSGQVLIQLRSGWNLIANPYPYSIPVGQLVGVLANGEQTLRWNQMANSIVSGNLSYWDAETQSYKFIDGSTAKLLPNRGYWIFVMTSQELTLAFPPVFEEFLPNSTRAPIFTNNDKQWRLNLVARTNDGGLDDQNFIGIAQTAADAKKLLTMEPPMSPTQQVALSIEGLLGGQPTRMAQSMSDRAGKQEFKVFVDAKKDGEVTLTWPNMSSMPKNMRYRLVDTATGQSRDLRSTSGYTFTASANVTREFKLQIEPGTGSRPLIGNVVVGRSDTRAKGSPIQINYTLTGSATTTIRILSGSGKEVFTVRRGRAESAGENTATWNLKDNANRAVAPGTYQVEILAEGDNGERVRRMIPVNVIR